MNNELQPTLNLYRNSLYRFYQSDPDNAGQRLFVSNDLDGRAVYGGSNASIQFPRQAMTSNSSQDCVASASTTQDSPVRMLHLIKQLMRFGIQDIINTIILMGMHLQEVVIPHLKVFMEKG